MTYVLPLPRKPLKVPFLSTPVAPPVFLQLWAAGSGSLWQTEIAMTTAVRTLHNVNCGFGRGTFAYSRQGSSSKKRKWRGKKKSSTERKWLAAFMVCRRFSELKGPTSRLRDVKKMISCNLWHISPQMNFELSLVSTKICQFSGLLSKTMMGRAKFVCCCVKKNCIHTTIIGIYITSVISRRPCDLYSAETSSGSSGMTVSRVSGMKKEILTN